MSDRAMPRDPAPVQARVPPGQRLTQRFPVLSVEPTPQIPLDQWSLTIEGLVREPGSWSWEAFTRLPAQTFVVDIHCVTGWSKLDTKWRGVRVDTLLAQVEVEPAARYVVASCYGGYTTNLPLDDVTGDEAFVAYAYAGEPLPPEHGGPARLVVPHLYLWKSAKWVRTLQLVARDQPGYWELYGYHNRGNPWQEQRYQ
jgi:DMSO/TMAO reductase YedYZ molybdopterin-dependent catalytic subunit